MRVLVVEDSHSLADGIVEGFETKGWPSMSPTTASKQ
jgi:DNA-binding response OmpR family regulator